jgi:hypothetical protein
VIWRMGLWRPRMEKMSNVVTSDSFVDVVTSYCAYSKKSALAFARDLQAVILVHNGSKSCASEIEYPIHRCSANSSRRSQASHKRRGRALNATTNIAQALKLSSFQQLPKHTQQTINFARDIQLLPSNFPASTNHATDLRASSNPQTCLQSVRSTLPSSSSANTH